MRKRSAGIISPQETGFFTLAGNGILHVASDPERTKRFTPRTPPFSGMPSITETVHGPASVDATIQSAEVVDDVLYVVSRNVQPARLAAFDLESEELVLHEELPEGNSGAHASIASAGTDLYFNLHGSRALYRFDTVTEELTLLDHVPGDDGAPPFGVGAGPDGRVYVGTRNADLYRYDPSADSLDLLTEVPGDLPVQRVVPQGDTVFVSAGPTAALFAVDPATGETHAIDIPELDGERIFKFVDASEDWLVVGSTPKAKVAIIDREAFEDYRVIRPEPETGKTIQTLRIVEDSAYFHAMTFTDRGRSIPLYRVDLRTEELTKLCTLSGRTNPVGLFVRDRPLVVPKQSLSQGRGEPIVHFDGPEGGADVVDLQAGGFPPRPEPPQSLTVSDDGPIVGAHAKLSFHDLDAGERWAVGMTGEPKAMLPGADSLYIASYPGALIQRYDFDREEPTVIKKIGHEQNRPRDIAYHPGRESIFVGTHPVEGFPGGAVAEYAPATDELTVDRHVLQDHSVSTVLPWGDGVIVGTEIPTNEQYRTVDLPDTAALVGWDPDERSTTWQLAPVDGAKTFKTLIERDGMVYGYTPAGAIFEVDPAAPEVTRSLSLPAGGGSLVEHGGEIYGVTEQRLFRLDVEDWSTTDLLEDFGGHWFNWPMIVTDGESMFTLRGTDLVEATVD